MIIRTLVYKVKNRTELSRKSEDPLTLLYGFKNWTNRYLFQALRSHLWLSVSHVH